MSTTTMPEINLSEAPDGDGLTPAQRLRKMAAAVRVQFTWWGVTRALSDDQKVGIGETYNADANLLYASKKILDVKHPAWKAVKTVKSKISRFWKSTTLPYVEDGVRLIKQSDIQAFVSTMDGFKQDLAEAETALNEVYEVIKDDAQSRLGTLFNPNDYPVEIKGMFSVAYDFPNTTPPSYLLKLDPELYKNQQAALNAKFEQAVHLAEQAFTAEFAQLVTHLTERLATAADGTKKVFRDSAITNLTEFFDKFKNMNVHSSKQLDALVEQAKSMVAGVNPEVIRENDDYRQQIATQLSGVQAALDGMMVDAPRRRIIKPNQEAKPEQNGETTT